MTHRVAKNTQKNHRFIQKYRQKNVHRFMRDNKKTHTLTHKNKQTCIYTNRNSNSQKKIQPS